MNRYAAILCVLLVGLTAFAEKEESLQQLIARADKAHADDRPALYIEVAERQLKAADSSYTSGNTVEANAAIQDVGAYSGKAHDAAVQYPKKLKATEISLRKMAARLRDMKRTLSFEDQAPVQAVVDRLESLRTDLQKRMFGGK